MDFNPDCFTYYPALYNPRREGDLEMAEEFIKVHFDEYDENGIPTAMLEIITEPPEEGLPTEDEIPDDVFEDDEADEEFPDEDEED